MEYITSTQSKKDYIANVKTHLDPLWNFTQDRYTGFFIGGFFSVTHHCEYNWFHRITSQMNSAIGYVSSTETGCTIHLIRFKGILHPLRFLPYILFCYIITTFKQGPWWTFPLTALLFTIVALIGTLIESFTQGSVDGEDALWALLLHPDNPYAHL